MRRFKREEVRKYNGKNGTAAYIVYEKSVYDVSRSLLWKGGRHQALHEAGHDLTSRMEQAPHGPDMLDRVILIGVIEKDSP